MVSWLTVSRSISFIISCNLAAYMYFYLSVRCWLLVTKRALKPSLNNLLISSVRQRILYHVFRLQLPFLMYYDCNVKVSCVLVTQC